MLDSTPPAAWEIDIAVTARGIVAPTVTNDGGASLITDITARLNGELTDNGNENPTVKIFYGAADGVTNPAAWTSNVSLGILGLGVFSYDAAGFTSNTTYYYRAYAENSANGSWAGSTANFTTLFAEPHPPTNFILTRLDENNVSANWTKGLNSQYTAILVSSNDYPVTPTDYLMAYYGDGTSCNLTWPIDNIPMFASAWGFASDNITYSYDYNRATIGGEGMTGISEAINGIGQLINGIGQLVIIIFAVAVISLIALWAFKTKYPLAFMFLFGVSFITSLRVYDAFDTPESLAISLVGVVFSFCMAGAAIYTMFGRPQDKEEAE